MTSEAEVPPSGHTIKFLEIMFVGDRARRLGGWIAVPAAEPGNDPAGPFQAFLGMEVLLKGRFALVLSVELVEDGYLMRGEGGRSRLGIGAVAARAASRW